MDILGAQNSAVSPILSSMNSGLPEPAQPSGAQASAYDSKFKVELDQPVAYKLVQGARIPIMSSKPESVETDKRNT